MMVVIIFFLLVMRLVVGQTSSSNDISGSYAVFAPNRMGISRILEYSESVKTVHSDFPEDIFSAEALRHGAIILHFVGALYSFAAIAIICGDYFLPSVDCICSDLNLSQDVAAATFMSFATTAPELFVILIATFLTDSDIGVGAVVGSGMFNILGVATVGGLAAIKSIKLDWWPLFRDSVVYVIAVAGLVAILSDGTITLPECAFLVVYYFVYFIVMFWNRRIRKKIKSLSKMVKKRATAKADKSSPVPTISLTLEDGKSNEFARPCAVSVSKKEAEEETVQDEEEDAEAQFKAFFVHYEDSISLRRISASSRGSAMSERRKSVRSFRERKNSDSYLKTNSLFVQANENNLQIPKLPEIAEVQCGDESAEESEVEGKQGFRSIFCTFPTESLWRKFTWVSLWPISFVFYCTIPDCRTETWKKFYVLTFLMCIFWIGVSSTFGTWMISRMGETIGISDSVMGLTFLALGGSMPEAISTYIMARQGEGGLGFSNSLGGNTMNVCLCLGMPWLIKCATVGQVTIYSEGIEYNALALLIGILVLISVGIYTKFHMNKKMGIICCGCYMIFIVISVLVELQVFS